VPTRGFHLAYSPGFRGTIPPAHAPATPPHQLNDARPPAPAAGQAW
jgi:hypothetical protein